MRSIKLSFMYIFLNCSHLETKKHDSPVHPSTKKIGIPNTHLTKLLPLATLLQRHLASAESSNFGGAIDLINLGGSRWWKPSSDLFPKILGWNSQWFTGSFLATNDDVFSDEVRSYPPWNKDDMSNQPWISPMLGVDVWLVNLIMSCLSRIHCRPLKLTASFAPETKTRRNPKKASRIGDHQFSRGFPSLASFQRRAFVSGGIFQLLVFTLRSWESYSRWRTRKETTFQKSSLEYGNAYQAPLESVVVSFSKRFVLFDEGPPRVCYVTMVVEINLPQPLWTNNAQVKLPITSHFFGVNIKSPSCVSNHPYLNPGTPYMSLYKEIIKNPSIWN